MTSALFSLPATRKLVSGAELAALVEGSEEDARELLKGAMLLYPRIVLFVSEASLDYISERLFPGTSAELRMRLRQSLRGIDGLDTLEQAQRSSLRVIMKDLDTWLETAQSVDPTLVIQLLQTFMEVYPKERRFDMTHPLVPLWLSVRSGLPYHEEADRAGALVSILRVAEPRITTSEELSFTLPPLDRLSWEAIWELINCPYIDPFRTFITKHIPTGMTEAEVAARISEALWSVVGEVEPSPTGSVVSRVVGQVPMPLGLPNPYSAYRDVRDGLQERSLYINYAWLFFMQRVRKAALGSSE
jgi:hypothetical protein